MSLQLRNGDYVPDPNGGFVCSTGGQEILERVIFKLTARRGQFPLLPELGSFLYRLPQEKPSDRKALAKQYVEQALTHETELVVEQVDWDEGQARVTAWLRWQGESLPVLVSLAREEGARA